MQLPPRTASSESHLNYVAHIDGACEAWRDASIITPDQRAVVGDVGDRVRAAADALRARMVETEDAQRVTSRARARFGVRDVMLDLTVMRVSDGVLNGPALRNREHPVYKTVFLGVTPTEITRTRMRDEPELVDRLRARLAEAPEFPAKAGLMDDVDGTLANSFDARKALIQAEDAERRAADVELTVRLSLRHAIEEAYGLLRAAFPGRRDFVESFFPKRDAKGGAETVKKVETTRSDTLAPVAQPA